MIVEARLRRPLSAGQIVPRGGRYFSRRLAMLYIAKALQMLKVVLLGGK